MDNLRKESKGKVVKATFTDPKEFEKKRQEVLHKVFDEGMRLKEALDITDQTMEFLYSQGYQFYKIGKYKDASRLFHMLYLLNASDLRYSMGIAACHHMQKEYLLAAEWYFICAALDHESPLPYYHISDCFFKMDNKVGALIVLKMMQVRLTDDPKYKAIAERASRMVEALTKELSVKQINETQASAVPETKTGKGPEKLKAR